MSDRRVSEWLLFNVEQISLNSIHFREVLTYNYSNIYARLKSTSNPQIHVRCLRHRHLYLRSMSSFQILKLASNDVTGVAYASNYVKPVRSGFWSNDGEPTRPDSRWRILDDKKKKKKKKRKQRPNTETVCADILYIAVKNTKVV